MIKYQSNLISISKKIIIFVICNVKIMACRYTFSEHESFPCKTLWLKEGYCFVVQRKVFNNSDAIVDLGVGKNMIDSSSYWLRAFGICKGDCLTRQGDYLFNEADGKEKYIEVLFAR